MVRYVAGYDSAIKKETLQIAKKVCLFWSELLDTDISKRKYNNFKRKYNEIESDIRILKVKNNIRDFNEIYTMQVNNILEL